MKIKQVNDNICNKYNKKICLIADIHFYYDIKESIFDQIINNIKKNKPDYICISGDITDRYEIVEDKMMEKLYKFLADLGKITKVFLILGNHDLTIKQTILETNLRKVKNVTLLEEKIIIGDLCFQAYNQSKETYQNESSYCNQVIKEINAQLNIDKTKYNILLAHNPIYLVKDKVFDNSKIKDCDLILSGHNHDGIITFLMPKNTSLISPKKKLFLKNGRGRIVKNKTNIIITGGITKLSNCSGSISKLNKFLPISINYITI